MKRAKIRQPKSVPIEEMNTEQLEQGLQIDEHDLDGALKTQPDYYYRVSKKLALIVSRRDELKMKLAEEEARADGEFRQTAIKHKDKVTETELKGMVRLDHGVQEAQTLYLKMHRRVGQLTALKESYGQRGFVLKDLVKLYIANYFGQAEDGSSASRMLKDHSAEFAKRRMNEARRKGNDDDDDD